MKNLDKGRLAPTDAGSLSAAMHQGKGTKASVHHGLRGAMHQGKCAEHPTELSLRGAMKQ